MSVKNRFVPLDNQLGGIGQGKAAPSILASGPCGVYILHAEMTSREGWPGNGVWSRRNSVPLLDGNSVKRSTDW